MIRFVRDVPSLALISLTLSACGALFGVDFDVRPGASDGGASPDTNLVSNVPGPVAPNEDGSCDETRKLCDGSCVSRLDAQAGCGGPTCEPCSLPHATAACTTGALCAVAQCKPGWSDCNGDPADGCETQTDSDPAHCGRCDKTCETGLVCGLGTCSSGCPSGTRACGAGSCQAESASSCGAGCVPCSAPAHGTAQCANGTCDFTCDGSFVRSGSTCVAPGAHDTWKTVASMPTARNSLAAATSTDGRIFAIGGWDGSKDFTTVEAYTPSSNSWTTVASMPTARSGLAAAVSADGRIFAIGGYDSTNYLTTVEAYTPSNKSWATVASMPTARSGLAAAVSADGRIFAIGGADASNYLNTVEAYTP